MRSALGVGHRMDLVDDHPADAREDPSGRARQEQEEGLRGRDQDVRRMAFDLPAVAGGRVAGADRDRDAGNSLPSLRGRVGWGRHPLRLQPDAAQRRLQVALDIDRERLQRRYVKHAAPLGLGGNRLRRQLVDAPQECCQRLATSRGGRHQRVLTGRDGPPAPFLNLGRRREGAREPGSRCRRKQVQNRGHGHQFMPRDLPIQSSGARCS